LSTVEATKTSKNGLGTAALVLGIVGIAGSAIPFLNIVSLIVASVGLLLGLLGLFAVKNKARGRALAGTIISGVAMIVAIIVIAVTAAAVTGLSEAVNNGALSVVTEEPVDGASDATTEVTGNVVTYQVTSDAATAGNVTYMTFDSTGAGQQQATDAALPFSQDIALEEGTLFSTSIFSLVAQASAESTTITCTVLHNGEVVATNTSTGAYAVVTCSGTGS
jgi:hypothetical protein